jgi:hypothetical protein
VLVSLRLGALTGQTSVELVENAPQVAEVVGAIGRGARPVRFDW